MAKRNKSRPYSDDLLLQIKSQLADLKERVKEIHVTVGRIQQQNAFDHNALKTQLEVSVNIDWIAQQLKEQGHLN